jgi:hypothetical protein
MQRNIQEKRILTHTTTNASKLTSDYFVAARATYNTKHVISFRIYPHSVQKFISYGADNKPRLHSYYLLYNAEGNNCCLLWCSGKEIVKLCDMEEGILCVTESSTCGKHCCTRCLIVILNLFMSLHDLSKRNSIIIYIYICVCVCVRACRYEKYTASFREISLRIYCFIKTQTLKRSFPQSNEPDNPVTYIKWSFKTNILHRECKGSRCSRTYIFDCIIAVTFSSFTKRYQMDYIYTIYISSDTKFIWQWMMLHPCYM